MSLWFTGVGAPNKLDFSLDYLLDAKKEKQKRLFMLSQEGTSTRSKTISMLKDREFKETFKVYLPGLQIHDKLTSLEVQLRYALGSQSGIKCCNTVAALQTRERGVEIQHCFDTKH